MYYEFTVQIYEDEETALRVYGNIKSMEANIKSCVGVLWEMERRVVKG